MTNGQGGSGGFDLNRPTIIAGLYILSFFVGLTGLVGVVLAYVWRGENASNAMGGGFGSSSGAWEQSHYSYLINTFWLGLAGTVIGVLLTLVVIGIPILIATVVLTVVRSVLSLIAAQKHEPMPRPDSWTW